MWYWIGFVRQNVTASGARPNPQGSFHYGQINVTQTYLLKSAPLVTISGSPRATLNGISFVNPDTPIRLADQNNLKGAYKLDFPGRPFNRTPHADRSVINATYKGFIEVVFQNNDTTMQSFHVNGYSFFVAGWIPFPLMFWTFNLQIIIILVLKRFWKSKRCFISGWVMVIGQKTKEVHTISGMQSAAVQHRLVLVLVFSSLLLKSNFFKDLIEATTINFICISSRHSVHKCLG